MTLPRLLARAALAAIEKAAGPLSPMQLLEVEAELEHAMKAAAAIMALAFTAAAAPDPLRAKGTIKSAPPLADQEWLDLFNDMVEGHVPIFHSTPDLQRYVTERMEK